MSQRLCPHCGEALRRFKLPDNTGWAGDHQLACFSDDCPYYSRGWRHMEVHYAVKASYRYRVDPTTGHASPLAVWSPTALQDHVLDSDARDPQQGTGG